MLHYGFWLCEYISISHIILKAPAQYGRAFLYTETDDNDLTYFILHQIEVIRRALDELHNYIETKATQLKAIERELRSMVLFNHRQREIVSHALRHPHHQYTIEGHKRSHNIVYQTARTDLLSLKERGILDAWKVGKTWYFTPVSDLEAKLKKLV
jgi:Fic family protein